MPVETGTEVSWMERGSDKHIGMIFGYLYYDTYLVVDQDDDRSYEIEFTDLTILD